MLRIKGLWFWADITTKGSNLNGGLREVWLEVWKLKVSRHRWQGQMSITGRIRAPAKALW